MKRLIFFIPLILISCGDGEDAIPEVSLHDTNIDSLITLYPDSIDLLIKRGNMRFDEGDFVGSMADGAKAYRIDSTNYEADLLYTASLNNKTDRTFGDIDLAQKHYHKLILKNPKDTRAWVGLASTYKQQQDVDNTFKYVNEALRIDPRCRDAYVLKGSTYLALNNRDLAKSSYETAIQQDGEFFEAYIALGWLYFEDNDRVAIERFRSALELKPNNSEAKYALAYALQNFGDTEEAKSIYRNLATDTSDYYVNRALFHQAYMFQFDEKNLDSAIYFYNSALRTDPTHVESWWNLGLIYSEQNNSALALQSYSKAAKYAKQKGYDEEFIEAIRKDARKEKDDFDF